MTKMSKPEIAPRRVRSREVVSLPMTRWSSSVRGQFALIATALLLAAVSAKSAQAQFISGRVLDSASAQPIPGAVVQALASDGRVLARALSDGRGAFALRVPETASVQLRVQRIGFRPRVVANVSSGSTQVAVKLLRIPAFLDPVRVVAAQCRRRGRTSPSGLIEQARAGLLASVVARDVNPAAMTRVTFERRYDRSGRRISWQRVRMDSSAASRTSFTAVSDAAGFVSRGFLLDDEEGATYFAPDAETLLDDAFAAGYCFRVMPADRERPNQVGLGFEASNRRRGRVDVNGALWIDTVTRELRDIEFRYEGLPSAIQAQRPGGRIEFATLPNGITIVSRWQLDPAGIEADTVAGTRAGSTQVIGRVSRYENGGELVRALWRDGTEWRGQLGTFVGRATWTDGRPARGLMYSLRNTPYRGETDSLGRLVLDGLLPGTYRVLIIDQALLEVGLSIGTDIEFTSNRDSVEMRLPGLSADDYVTNYCRNQGRYNPDLDHTYLLVRALWDDGTPVEGASWSVRILDRDGATEVEVGGKSGNDGIMALCQNLIRDVEVEVLVVAPSGMGPVARRRLVNKTTIIPIVFARP